MICSVFCRSSSNGSVPIISFPTQCNLLTKKPYSSDEISCYRQLSIGLWGTLYCQEKKKIYNFCLYQSQKLICFGYHLRSFGSREKKPEPRSSDSSQSFSWLLALHFYHLPWVKTSDLTTTSAIQHVLYFPAKCFRHYIKSMKRIRCCYIRNVEHTQR